MFVASVASSIALAVGVERETRWLPRPTGSGSSLVSLGLLVILGGGILIVAVVILVAVLANRH